MDLGGGGTTRTFRGPWGPLIPAAPRAKRNALVKSYVCLQSARNSGTEASAPACGIRALLTQTARVSPGRHRAGGGAGSRRSEGSGGGFRALVRTRERRMRRRRLEVTSPKSVLVPGHLSSRRPPPVALRIHALRGSCLKTLPLAPAHPLRPLDPPKGLSFPSVPSPVSGRTGPSRAARARSLTMASLFKKKTVDGEFQAGLAGPSSAFPRSLLGASLRFWPRSLGAGLDQVAPQVTALAASLLCFAVS